MSVQFGELFAAPDGTPGPMEAYKGEWAAASLRSRRDLLRKYTAELGAQVGAALHLLGDAHPDVVVGAAYCSGIKDTLDALFGAEVETK